MGYTKIDIITDPLEGEILIAEGEARKGGAYIARITDTDPKYRYARDFISETQRIGSYKDGIKRAFVHVKDLHAPFDLLEIRAGGSWKNDYRNFYLFDADKRDIRRITETELRKYLAQLKAARNKRPRKSARSVIKLNQKGGEIDD